jgi:tetratricopeptide (TPR) repeat protein
VTARFRFAIFVTTAMSVLGCAVTFAQANEKWISVRSKNFSIIGNAATQQIQEAANRLEQFRWAFSKVYPRLKLDNGKPTEIVIFRDAEAYFDFLPRRPDGSADVGVAGYFQAGEDTNYITFAVSQRQADPFSTAIHEFVHSVLDANFDRAQLPPWLSEGLAEYFETLRIDKKKVLHGESQTEHIRLLQRAGAIPLAEFLNLTTTDLKTISPERRRIYYAEAWAIVSILMSKNRSSIDSLATQNFTASAELNEAVKKLVAGSFENATAFAIDGSLPVPDAVETSDVSASAVSARLGDLLLHTGEFARSESFLRKALDADPNEPLANASLGLLLLRQEKAAEARPFLEKAVAAGSVNHLVLTGCAFSMLEPFTKNGNEIPDNAASEMGELLRRAAAIEPRYTESYRLSALIDFLRDAGLDQALSLLQRALAIKRDDPELLLLTARILLRREKIDLAREAAERVTSSSANEKQRSEASEIIKAAYEYAQARSTAQPVKMNITLGERQSLVILKRSWLTDADVAQINEDRMNNNFNRIILRAAAGESQIVGRIEQITCKSEKIVYRVRSRDGTVTMLSGTDFSSIRMSVAREGESSFQIGCDASLANELAVINYQPTLAPATDRSVGYLTAISFVPEGFRLKTFAEMIAARPVAIDDDMARRSGPSAEVNSDTIHRSIAQSLRKVHKDEQRIAGTIETIECSSGNVVFTITAMRKTYKLAQSGTSRPEIGWFTVASSQIPLTCGSGAIGATTLITYVPGAQNDTLDGIITAIEFVPDGFIP